ncbi:MAG: hypothetical protein QNJ45_21010 [Ardenticatenaceae bacterium]|nr:hypothetical protein [Ardenticatenaceae bacterium]
MVYPPAIDAFIDRWTASQAAERANYQLFLSELCDILDVNRPDPTTGLETDNAYAFEKSVRTREGSTKRIDLYKRGCFVLEAKQGSNAADTPELASAKTLQQYHRRKKGTAKRGTKGWDVAMQRAKRQGEQYIRLLPQEEIRNGRPPFLIIVDVGATIELYAEFTRTGGTYVPYPDPANHRIKLDDLRDEQVRQVLKQVWEEPLTLDPSRRSARVTRMIAAKLAELARSLEGPHDPETVAGFLMRCLFTMFAEDIGLLPERSFTQLLDDLKNAPDQFQPMVEHLWQTMKDGGFNFTLRQQIPHFNGVLFEQTGALPLSHNQIDLLTEAAGYDWKDVEPAIFGTLLERALDPIERHKLGAHYTPRAYVERLVQPTVIEPLREEWDAVQAAALQHSEDGRSDKAIAEVEAFQRKLAKIKILDPACGSGNFLYVTLELLKRLEGEVQNTLREIGQGQLSFEISGVQVTPAQFLGIEINPRAAAIAELVLWIGFLQWQQRTKGTADWSEPIIKAYHTIENRDAVLEWDEKVPLLDENGQPVTRWDGRTTKTHPVTGEQVPDEAAQIPLYRYINPRPAEWPAADYVVGNPPFIGTARMREALGDGYAEAVRKTYKNVPNSADYVMFWWDKAAALVRAGDIERFGLITTNSLRQTFNRRVLQHHMNAKSPLSLVFAIPDHPWVDSEQGAAVRISMTVAKVGESLGSLNHVYTEDYESGEHNKIKLNKSIGKIFADLSIGADLSQAAKLDANSNISNRGFELGGAGFIVTPNQAETLGKGTNEKLDNHILSYLNGRDLAQTSRNVFVIDLYGLSEDEVRIYAPEVYQWLIQRVKPERDQNRSKKLRENWWLHRRLREDLRMMLKDLSRFISTIETSKHRYFVLLDKEIFPDNRLVNFGVEDAYFLGVLSSKPHVLWSIAAGGRMGVGNDLVYTKTRCFETFSFPDPIESVKVRIRELGEQLDAHRKRQQELHPDLTMTGMYNVLEKIREIETSDNRHQTSENHGEDQPRTTVDAQQTNNQYTHTPITLSAKEKDIYDKGLIGILKQIHDDLDAAVFDAYGWPHDLSDEEILERLVELNKERAAEEARGIIRYLRPEYQNPEYAAEQQASQAALIDTKEAAPAPPPAEQRPWPKSLAERAQALRAALAGFEQPVTVKEVAQAFKGRATKKKVDEMTELLETLVVLGQAQGVEGGRYLGV